MNNRTQLPKRDAGGLVVERRTPNGEVLGSTTMLCP